MEPGPMARARARPGPRPAAGALAGLLTAAGCLGDGGTLARWRMAHDQGLAKGPTKEELGDDRSLMARWLAPNQAHVTPKADKETSTRFGGSDGWATIKTARHPKAAAAAAAAQQRFQR